MPRRHSRHPYSCIQQTSRRKKRLLNDKKLSNEIIMGKTTEDTAMELDGEGAANFEQLQDLIRKECDKCDRKYAQLEDKCNKLEQPVKNPRKNMPKRGRSPNHEEPGASKKKKSNQRNAPKQQRSRSKSTPANNSGAKKRRNHESPGQAGKKTAIPSKKIQTNLHRRHKANQLGIHPITLARKNRQRGNSEKTNRTIWIR